MQASAGRFFRLQDGFQMIELGAVVDGEAAIDIGGHRLQAGDSAEQASATEALSSSFPSRTWESTFSAAWLRFFMGSWSR